MTQQKPTDDEVAAALAAVQYFLEAETAHEPPPTQRSAWREAALLAVQHIASSRMPAPTWGNIERLRRKSTNGSF